MQFDFYQLSRKTQDSGLMTLVEKALEAYPSNLLICKDKEEVKRLDQLLWTHSPHNFIPHDLKNEQSPLFITNDLSKSQPAGATIFFNLVDYPEETKEGKRVLVLFNGEDETILNATRQFFKIHKNEENTLNYWQLKNGKWTKAA